MQMRVLLSLKLFRLTGEWGEGRTAMTGIVLIDVKHALANADDVVRIPEGIFKKNSRAVFFPARNTPRFVKLSSYVTHPEYQHSTLNSIAIIELKLAKVKDFRLTPICLPAPHTPHALRDLYLTGITDSNKKLEKIVYKIQYLDYESCEDYDDNRWARVTSQNVTPAYLCGYAPNTVRQCVWENGMALVSNATGTFNLIGLAVYGHGCTSPARFMDLFPYMSWIHSIIRPDGDDLWRKTKVNKPIPNVPIHKLFEAKHARRQNVLNHDSEPYPFDVESLKFHFVKPTKDNNSVIITIKTDKWELHVDACSKPRNLVYRENFDLTAVDHLRGSVTYKLKFYDFRVKMLACVRLTFDCKDRSNAILKFKEELVDNREGTELREESGETPEELFKYFPVVKNEASNKDKDLYRPIAINDENVNYSRHVMNYDLFVTFDFDERAVMQFDMFAGSAVVSAPIKIDPETTTIPSLDTTKDYTTTTDFPGKISRRRTGARPVAAWGIDNWKDYMVREAKVRLVVDVEKPREVQETQSAARIEEAPGAVVMTCWLIGSCLRRLFSIH